MTLDQMLARATLADHFFAKSTEDQFSPESFHGVIAVVEQMDGQAFMQKSRSFRNGCGTLFLKLMGGNELTTDLHSGQPGRIRLVPFPVEVGQSKENGSAKTDKRKARNAPEEVSNTFSATLKHVVSQQQHRR